MTLPLAPLEIATGDVLGSDPAVVLPTRGPRPRERLEELMAERLRRPPCGISFSGGCDSSVLLALATHVARRDGLDDPIPVTGVYPGLPETDETAWQHLVMDHLKLREWDRVEITDEQTLLGPYARRALALLGLHFTPTLYQSLPYLERVRGGSLTIGVDGDTVFAHAWRAHRREALWGLRRPGPRDVLALSLYAAPHAVRRMRFYGFLAPLADMPWLTPAARRRYRWALASHFASHPLHWQSRTAHVARWRAYTHIVQNMDALARSVGARAHFPLLDPTFLAALGASTGPMGYVDRADALVALFGDLLPEEVLRRRDKAHFTRAVWGEREHEFARDWNGAGVDPRLVDPAALRATWAQEEPDARSTLLLQQAWLASGGEQLEQRALDAGEAGGLQRAAQDGHGQGREVE